MGHRPTISYLEVPHTNPHPHTNHAHVSPVALVSPLLHPTLRQVVQQTLKSLQAMTNDDNINKLVGLFVYYRSKVRGWASQASQSGVHFEVRAGDHRRTSKSNCHFEVEYSLRSRIFTSKSSIYFEVEHSLRSAVGVPVESVRDCLSPCIPPHHGPFHPFPPVIQEMVAISARPDGSVAAVQVRLCPAWKCMGANGGPLTSRHTNPLPPWPPCSDRYQRCALSLAGKASYVTPTRAPHLPAFGPTSDSHLTRHRPSPLYSTHN